MSLSHMLHKLCKLCKRPLLNILYHSLIVDKIINSILFIFIKRLQNAIL